jgi:hypothetical protein
MTAAAVRAALDRRVTREEVDQACRGPISDDERAEALELIRWFTTRYPTPQERLAYVRAAYRRWRSATESGR